METDYSNYLTQSSLKFGTDELSMPTSAAYLTSFVDGTAFEISILLSKAKFTLTTPRLLIASWFTIKFHN